MKRKLYFLTIFMCIFGGLGLSNLNAQETITIGNANASSYVTPVDVYSNYYMSQQIYTADEIAAAGGAAGTITQIGFNRAPNSGKPTRNWSIYLTNTAENSFPHKTFLVSSSDKVYSGSFDICEGWNTFTFNILTAFEYTGGNLLVTVVDNTGTNGGDCYWWGHESSLAVASGRSTMFSPESVVENMSPGYTKRNQIQLTFEGGTAPTLTATAVTDSSVNLSWDASANATTYNVYQDETLISNVSVTSAQITGLNPETEYCFTVTAVNGDDESDHSNEVCVTTLSGAGSDDGKVIGEWEGADALPIYTTNEYAYSQQIYTSEELGINVACEINEISFYKTNSYSATRNLEIYMLNTDKSSFSANDWVDMNNSYKVFDGEYTFTEQSESEGENECKITLDNPFLYIPGKNILVCVVDKTATRTANLLYFKYMTLKKRNQ